VNPESRVYAAIFLGVAAGFLACIVVELGCGAARRRVNDGLVNCYP
jgi:hypothetical protein